METIDNNAILLKLAERGILAPIMNASNDGISYTDENGTIIYSNRTYQKLTGIDADEVSVRSIFQLSQEGYPVSQMMVEVFERRTEISKMIKYRADSERKVVVTVNPVYNAAGDFAGGLAVFRDMTELLHLRQKLDVFYLRKQEEDQKQENEKQTLLTQINGLLHLVEEYDVVGKSQHMQSLAELAYRISNVNSTVLITGESGVGKDVFCQMVSRFSGHTTYTKISCGAIPETLLESELFGYEAGAFTGAKKEGKPGIFEMAGEGIVFLDEIGEMPMAMQVKLLTVLQDRKFLRIGGVKEIPVKARIITATNRNLREEIKAGTFRQDLYYRLNVIPVSIKPLRERKEDILPLAEHILKDLNEKYNSIKILSAEIQQLLIRYEWPGNIRELRNLIERMYVLSFDETIGMEVLPEEIAAAFDISVTLPQVTRRQSLKEAMEEYEAAYLRRQLSEDMTLEDIARSLDVNISTLVRKINKYQLPKRYKKTAQD